MTWLKPSGSCFLIGLVHTRMMPGYSEGRASAALIALSICAGVASAFHWIVITWITVFGLGSAANRPVANIMAAAQVPRNICLVMFSPHRILTLEPPQNAAGPAPFPRPPQRALSQR